MRTGHQFEHNPTLDNTEQMTTLDAAPHKRRVVNGLLLTYMATLDELDADGVVQQIKLRVKHERRKIYLCAMAKKWFHETLPNLTAFDPEDERPIAQVWSLFNRFIEGDDLEEGDEYRLMRPEENDVYELKSPDTRFYGWFVKPGVFVAVCADSMEKVHQHCLATSYRKVVEAERVAINLDVPKYTPGASKEHVFSF